MTRYARAGKGTHQRVAKESTPWDELKPAPPERVRGSNGPDGDRPLNKRPKKERFNRGKGAARPPGSKFNTSKDKFSKPKLQDEQDDTKDNSASKSSSSSPKSRKGNQGNVRGYGQSKSIKIFGQFWVPCEDAKRLKNLLQKLKAQGLPRREILEVLKNDRRKAERTAKRQRDKTCYQCRQFGHVLSDCPNIKKAIAVPEGGELEFPETEQAHVCFKCGSTEHTSRNCRKQGEKFEFAKCFICTGSGHIARQCPQNSNGIYPGGGSCSECGSTAHLKKDCPDLVGVDISKSQDDQDAVTLRVMDPFSSTEYEPSLDIENNDLTTNDTVEKVNHSTPEQTLNKRKPIPQGKKKRSKNSDGNDTSFNLEDVQYPDVQKPIPKKRKVVKF